MPFNEQSFGGRYIAGPLWNQHGDGKTDRYVKTISLPAQSLVVDLYVRQEEHADFLVMRYGGQTVEDFFITTFERLLTFLVFSYPSLLSQQRCTEKDGLRAVVYRHVLRLLMNSGCFETVCRQITGIHVLSQPIPHFENKETKRQIPKTHMSSPDVMPQLTPSFENKPTQNTGYAGVARCWICGTFNPWLSPVLHCTHKSQAEIEAGISWVVETTRGCRRCAAKDAQYIVAIADNYDAAERVANKMNVEEN